MTCAITLGANGAKAALMSRAPSARGLRGECCGWSLGASRRNRDFLWSIEVGGLVGRAVSATLTVRNCPASAAEWQRLRDVFLKRVRRTSLVAAFHWVCEWQIRSSRADGRVVPHLHAVFLVFGDPEQFCRMIVSHWLDLASCFGAKAQGQHAAVIWELSRWLEYLAKHAARGAWHYQRQRGEMPEAWQKTGRLWGYGGDWPRREAVQVELSTAAFHRFRRMMRAFEAADLRARALRARTSGRNDAATKYLRATVRARRMHSRADPRLSALLPAAGWLPFEVSARLALWAAAADREFVRIETAKFQFVVRNPRAEEWEAELRARLSEGDQ